VAGSAVVQAAGWVEADPYKSYVTALADGIVREVLVLEGEPVEKDQVVVRLVDDDARLALKQADSEVLMREAALESAKADFTAAEIEWKNPTERKRSVDVAESDLKESRASLDQASADIQMEEALLEQAKNDYDRAVPLNRAATLAETELIRLRTKYQAQQAKLESTRLRHSVLAARIARNEADVLAAQEHMRLRTEERRKLDSSKSAVMRAEAELSRAVAAREEARLRLQRMEIRSPVSGIVMRRLTEPGSKLVISVDNPTSAYVLSLYDPSRIQLRVDVPLAEVAKVGVGQSVEVAVEVLPDKVFAGTVTRVMHEANIQKNTLEVKVAIADPAPELRPEMLARARFLSKSEAPTDRQRQGMFAPASVFRSGGGTVTTWVLKDYDGDRGVARMRTVTLGNRQTDGWVEVLEGLQPADRVITQSSSELKENKRVRVIGES